MPGTVLVGGFITGKQNDMVIALRRLADSLLEDRKEYGEDYHGGRQDAFVFMGGFKMDTSSRLRWVESRKASWRRQQAQALNMNKI